MREKGVFFLGICIFFLYSGEKRMYKSHICHPLTEGRVGWVIQVRSLPSIMRIVAIIKTQKEEENMKSVKMTVAFALMLLLATGLVACKKTEETIVVPPVEQAAPVAPVAPAVEPAAPVAAPEAAPAAPEAAPAAPAAK